MASQNLNVGTAANANDGDTLRAAFINVRKMIHEIYGSSDTYTDSLDLSGLSFDESIQDIIGAMVSGNTESNISVTYDDTNGKLNFSVSADITDVNAGAGMTGTNEGGGAATLNVIGGDGITVNADEVEATVDGTTLELSASDGSGAIRIKDLGVSTAKLAADSVTSAKIADDAIDSEHYVDGSIDTAHIADDQITYAKLENRYTEVQTITTTSGTINLDASSYTAFRLTSDLTGATTLNIQNMLEGQVIDITVSGSQTITFSSDDTTETFNKVGGTDYDGAEDNHIQVICLEDSDSGAIYNYTIGTYTSDTTP